MLLENKAQVDLQNNNGWPSLMIASQRGLVGFEFTQCHSLVYIIMLEGLGCVLV